MSQFVDECQLNVRAGDGGAGCVSFRREGPVAMGGPNGGDGGKGGDVWLVADRNVASLLAFRDHPHRIAGNGVHGKGKDLHGRRGESLEVKVPEGTVVRDMYSGEVLADLQNHGERHVPAVIGAHRRVYGLPGAADLDALRREVREGARAVEVATGRVPGWYRAATARYDEQALEELSRLGVRIAGFSLNADAGGTLAAAEVAARVGRARDGDVILAHLNRPASGTRAGLEQALPPLRARGIAFVHLGTGALVEAGARQP